MNRTQNLRAQIAMLPKTWDAFCANGITAATLLILDFNYVAPSKSAAESLAASLVSTQCRVRSEGGLHKRWFVEGQTAAPMTTSLEKLQSWLEFMVDAGWKHECAFDGFGAQIP